jgi:hypothetical protein
VQIIKSIRYGGVSTLWIYDLTIFNKLFYDKALLAYRNNHIHIVETPPKLEFLTEKEEQKVIAPIYGFISDGCHKPLGFSEEEFARFGRNLAISMCYFLIKKFEPKPQLKQVTATATIFCEKSVNNKNYKLLLLNPDHADYEDYVLNPAKALRQRVRTQAELDAHEFSGKL